MLEKTSADFEFKVGILGGKVAFTLNSKPSDGGVSPAKKQVVRWTSSEADLVIRINNPGAMVPGKEKSPFKEPMYCGSRDSANGIAVVEAQVKNVAGLLNQYEYTVVLVRDDGTCVSEDPRIIIRESDEQ